MKKRIISAILVLCLMLTMIPMASAAGTPTITNVGQRTHITERIGSNQIFLRLYHDDDGVPGLSLAVLFFAAEVTGNETQEELNRMAEALFRKGETPVKVDYVGQMPEDHEPYVGDLPGEMQLGGLPKGDYLGVHVLGRFHGVFDAPPEYVDFTPMPETALAVHFHLYDPADFQGHDHVWDEGVLGEPNIWTTEACVVYTCQICGYQEKEYTHVCLIEKFQDAPALSNWAHYGMDFCVAAELMKGVSEDRFDLNGMVTRAQFATILWRMVDCPEPEGKAPFVDVRKNSYYEQAAVWAYENGLINGTDSTHFSPEIPLSREMCATIFYRFSKDVLGIEMKYYLHYEQLEKYADYTAISPYAKDAMTWVTVASIVEGSTSGNRLLLKPKSSASRAEIATIVLRYFQYLNR